MEAKREAFETLLESKVTEFGLTDELHNALKHAFKGPAKRFRPQIVYSVASALNSSLCVDYAALSVEAFHTASLIIDDLPCMDDDDVRRNKPSLHKAKGESVAILTSFGLITKAFEWIILQPSQSKERTILASKIASRCAGYFGAVSGQYNDLFPPLQKTEHFSNQVIYQKTITLFETAFCFGWIFGGGELKKLELVRKASYDFGMAFQIADDLRDLSQDKLRKDHVNIALTYGIDTAAEKLNQSIEGYLKKIKLLGINTQELSSFADKIQAYASALAG